MGILTWIVFGLLAGYIAKMVLPGSDPGGLILTCLIGVAGATIGGFLGTYLGFGAVSGFDIRSLGVAIVGAIALLLLLRLIRR